MRDLYLTKFWGFYVERPSGRANESFLSSETFVGELFAFIHVCCYFRAGHTYNVLYGHLVQCLRSSGFVPCDKNLVN